MLNNSAYARMIAFGKTKNDASNTLNGNEIKREMRGIRIPYSTKVITSIASMHHSKRSNMVHRIAIRMIRMDRMRNPIWTIVRTMNRTIGMDWWHAFQRNNVIRYISCFALLSVLNCEYKADMKLKLYLAQQVSSTTNNNNNNNCVTVMNAADNNLEQKPPFNYFTNAKYKNQIMEKYLRGLDDSDGAQPSKRKCGLELSKWLESAANFTPEKNNYIEWESRRYCRSIRCWFWIGIEICWIVLEYVPNTMTSRNTISAKRMQLICTRRRNSMQLKHSHFWQAIARVDGSNKGIRQSRRHNNMIYF